MPIFIISARIQIAGKNTPATTGIIRLEIPAETQQQAEAAAKKFLLHRAEVIIEDCRPRTHQDEIAELAKGFMDALKGSSLFKDR